MEIMRRTMRIQTWRMSKKSLRQVSTEAETDHETKNTKPRVPIGKLPELNSAQEKATIDTMYSNLVHSRWHDMNKMKSSLTPQVVSHVLIKCRNDSHIAQRFYSWAEIHSRIYSHTLETACIIFHILTKAKKFKSAEMYIKDHILNNPVEKVWQTMVATFTVCGSSPGSFDGLFKAYAHRFKIGGARFVFIKMRGYGYLPNTKSCFAYLNSLSKRQRYDYLQEFYEEMQKCGIKVDSYIMSLVIYGLCKQMKLQEAWSTLNEMKDKGLSPNVVSYNVMIDGYCKSGLIASAMKLMREMMSNNLAPDVFTYNELINGLCKDGNIDSAFRLFREMEKAGLPPDTVTYNTLIGASNSETALSLYEEMLRRDLEPTHITYNSLLNALCRDGRMKKAISLLNEMTLQKIETYKTSYAALVQGYCKRKDTEQAMVFFQKMARDGTVPSYAVYKALIVSLCEEDDIDDAGNVLEEMVKNVLVPDIIIFNALVGALCKRKRVKGNTLIMVERAVDSISESSQSNDLLLQNE